MSLRHPMIFAALLAAAPATADLAVRFDEGAPKDRFSFENTGACAIEGATVTLDLGGSAAGLIFDVTSEGAGVEVFQPLEFVSGVEALMDVPEVIDGQNTVTLNVANLAPGAVLAFTIDVDDTLGGREITVARSEIVGANVTMSAGDLNATAAFDESASAVLTFNACAA